CGPFGGCPRSCKRRADSHRATGHGPCAPTGKAGEGCDPRARRPAGDSVIHLLDGVCQRDGLPGGDAPRRRPLFGDPQMTRTTSATLVSALALGAAAALVPPAAAQEKLPDSIVTADR